MSVADTTERSIHEIGSGLSAIREPLDRARHVPGYVYNSNEILEREKERLFMKDWLMICREEEVETPGDFMTFRPLGEPVVVTRDADGQLHALANVCQHRGVEVASGSGNAQEFLCPYHGWLYDLTGKLVGAPYMKEAEGFDPSTCRLQALQVATWGGFVFICFDDTAPPFEAFAADFIREFSFLQPEQCRLSKKIVLDLDCNWKFLIENVMDMYHAHTLHGQSFGQHTSYDNLKVSLFDRGGVRSDYASGPIAPDGQTLFGKMPWLSDKPDDFALFGYMQPNTYIVCRVDQVRMLITWPIEPGKCQGLMYSLFPKEHFSEPDFWQRADKYHDYLAYVLGEDADMVKSLQRGMGTRAFQPGPMAELEQPIHHVLNAYLDRMFD